MQRTNMKNEFDEELISLAKAIIVYCKRSCVESVAIQSIVKDINIYCKFNKMLYIANFILMSVLVGDEQILLKALRCLCLLLIYNNQANRRRYTILYEICPCK